MKANKTLYIRAEDRPFWDKAKRLIPFHLGLTISQFCSDSIRLEVERLQKVEGRSQYNICQKCGRLKPNCICRKERP